MLPGQYPLFRLIDAGLGGSGLVSKRALKHVLGEIRDASGLSLALFGGKGELLALSEGEGQLFEELEKEGLVSDRLKEYVRSWRRGERKPGQRGGVVLSQGQGMERGEGFVLAGTGKEDVLLFCACRQSLSQVFSGVRRNVRIGTFFFRRLILGSCFPGRFQNRPGCSDWTAGPAGCIFNKSKGGWLRYGSRYSLSPLRRSGRRRSVSGGAGELRVRQNLGEKEDTAKLEEIGKT